MASPLRFNGGLSLSVSNPITTVALNFKSRSVLTYLDTNLTNHVTMQVGGKGLLLHQAYIEPPPYNPSLMMALF